MHILTRLISFKSDGIMSALFTAGNLLNVETETIKRRLWTKVSPVLCFMSNPTVFNKQSHIIFIDH